MTLLREWRATAEAEAMERMGKPRSNGMSEADLVRMVAALAPALAGALRDATAGAEQHPVLDADAATELIFQLPAMIAFGKEVHRLSGGQVPTSVRVEHVPKLDAPRGSPDRAWHLAFAESQPTHLVTHFRFAIDLDSGAVSFGDVFNDRLVPYGEWKPGQ